MEGRDQDEVLHVWKRYHLDELPYTFTRVFLTEKPVRTVAPILFVIFIIGFIDIIRFEAQLLSYFEIMSLCVIFIV